LVAFYPAAPDLQKPFFRVFTLWQEQIYEIITFSIYT